MLTIKIWHIGHYSSEEWFGQNDTKLSVERCDDNDTYRDDDEKEEKKNDKKDDKKDEKKKKSVAFKASSSSKARQSKKHQVKMNAQALMNLIMRRWLSL
jgi:hypothetical protein